MKYRVLTREEFDEGIKDGIIINGSPGYWSSSDRTLNDMCLILGMYEHFGKEIPDFHNGIRQWGYGWNTWMVRTYDFNPKDLNDKILLNTTDKKLLQKYYEKESQDEVQETDDNVNQENE